MPKVTELPPVREKLRGLLLGTAVGDALGLPMEGLNPIQIRNLGWFPNADSNATTTNYLTATLRHRLIFGRGMISDDTEHALLVGLCLLRFPNTVEQFRSCLAWRLRLWFLALPPGIGLATARATIKLLLGISPLNSGVYSAGNGPAMRAAIIGAVCYRDLNLLKKLISTSTCMTHTDNRAQVGALAVALGAAYVMNQSSTTVESASQRNLQLLQQWQTLAPEDTEWQELLSKLAAGLNAELSVADLVYNLGFTNGISGYIYQTVPVALYAWLRHYGDFATTLSNVLALGGDTDTVGAIAGALAGVVTGDTGIPKPWIDGIADWPRSTNVLIQVADALTLKLDATTQHATTTVRYFYPAVFVRNMLFLMIILFHGLCRLLPLSINPLRERTTISVESNQT